MGAPVWPDPHEGWRRRPAPARAGRHRRRTGSRSPARPPYRTGAAGPRPGILFPALRPSPADPPGAAGRALRAELRPRALLHRAATAGPRDRADPAAARQRWAARRSLPRGSARPGAGTIRDRSSNIARRGLPGGSPRRTLHIAHRNSGISAACPSSCPVFWFLPHLVAPLPPPSKPLWPARHRAALKPRTGRLRLRPHARGPRGVTA